MHSLAQEFKKWPQRADHVWQAVSLDMSNVAPELHPTLSERPLAMCVCPQSIEAGISTTPDGPRTAIDALLDAMVNLSQRDPHGPYRPGCVELAEPELIPKLSEILTDTGIQVRPATSLDALEALVDGLQQAAVADLPSLLDKRGVTPDDVRDFAEAARAFYAAAPWEQLTVEDLILVQSPKPPREFATAVVLGSGGPPRGLQFFSSARRFMLAQTADLLNDYETDHDGWAVEFGPETMLVPADRQLWQRESLPIADPQAYPTFGKPDEEGYKRPTKKALQTATALLLALAATTESQIDEGAWRVAVPTDAGTLEVALELVAPELTGPSRQSLFGGRPRVAERAMIDMQRAVRDIEFSSPEEMNAYLNEHFTGRPVPRQPARTPLEAADDLVFDALETRGRQRRKLLRQAIETSPDCAAAYAELAQDCHDPAEARALYEQAAAAGERALATEGVTEETGNLWGSLRARPYLRALQGLVEACLALDDAETAVDVLYKMLRLNEDDNQGARYRLADVLLELNRNDELQTLLARYDEPSAHWRYLHALSAFRQHGDCDESRRELHDAHLQNKHVRRYLLDPAQLAEMSPYFDSPGDESEAQSIAAKLLPAWQATPDALDWLSRHTTFKLHGGGKNQKRKRRRRR